MEHLEPGRGHAPHADGHIAYLVAGEGPPVATAHPSGTPKAGNPALPGFATITVWPRGFGESSPGRNRDDYGLYALPDYLDAVRRHLGLEQWAYLGVSQGGMVGLVYALKYPDTLSGLIVDSGAAGSFYRQDPASIWPEVWASEQSAAFQRDPNWDTMRDFNLMVSGLMGSGDPVADWEAGLRTRDQNPDAYVAFRRTHFDLRNRLRQIRVPTLVLVGDLDVQCPPAQSRIIAEGIPGAQFHEFPNTPHGVVRHNPPGACEIIQRFLSQSPTGG